MTDAEHYISISLKSQIIRCIILEVLNSILRGGDIVTIMKETMRQEHLDIKTKLKVLTISLGQYDMTSEGQSETNFRKIRGYGF